MATYKVSVKWGKEKFNDIEVHTSEPTEVFKAQLMALTGVEPDRQKVMLKGSVLKDSWDSFKGLKDGSTVLLMGSATALPQAPVEKTMFVEDMNEQQIASHMKLPVGLVNLGNTCYMNATVQCLRSIPELRQALSAYSSRSSTIVEALKSVVGELEAATGSVTPFMLLHVLFNAFPRFAERAEQGGFVQQDANECWVELVRCLQQDLRRPGQSRSFVDEYMRIDLSQTMKCSESAEEFHSTDTKLQLSCFIDKDVKYLQTGLNHDMKEIVEKHSEELGRNAEFEKTSKISRLPAYLAIQFVRFRYKSKSEVNAKILKDIKYTMSLDLFEYCTPELQQKLTPMREKMKEEEDRQLEAVSQAKQKGEPLKKEKDTVKQPFSFPDDEGSNNSGLYELQAVMTHKGRSTVSGHYVAWIRHPSSSGGGAARDEDDWVMFDDDNVSVVHSEDILKLSGGGDWHTAYVLLYKPKILELEKETTNLTTENTSVN